MSETELEDFYDPGMHGTWLVKDTEAFPLNPGPTSERDRTRKFIEEFKGTAESNNSFNRTRNERASHRELEWRQRCLPRRLIRALGGYRVAVTNTGIKGAMR